ncbi:hypothetical protein H8356DRAFT_273123 [Neocallimastix lanati (nom. inval.)]|nr:hypothetical protein H8356DRAFT_273123 [Neocallimastix sp. JGI-2020a]
MKRKEKKKKRKEKKKKKLYYHQFLPTILTPIYIYIYIYIFNTPTYIYIHIRTPTLSFYLILQKKNDLKISRIFPPIELIHYISSKRYYNFHYH